MHEVLGVTARIALRRVIRPTARREGPALSWASSGPFEQLVRRCDLLSLGRAESSAAGVALWASTVRVESSRAEVQYVDLGVLELRTPGSASNGQTSMQIPQYMHRRSHGEPVEHIALAFPPTFGGCGSVSLWSRCRCTSRAFTRHSMQFVQFSSQAMTPGCRRQVRLSVGYSAVWVGLVNVWL